MNRKGVTAVIPIRLGLPRKTRLAARLSPAERETLADRLFSHVLGIVCAHPPIRRTVVLSPSRPADSSLDWRLDRGRGLNAELECLRDELSADDLLIVHGDLPLLSQDDIAAMIDGAQATGVALAPDRVGEGTNAVALHAQAPLPFAFGSGSFASHMAATGGKACLVRSLGLGLDVDSPEDLDAAVSHGFAWGVS
jgi:2-phospho-L-lactate guanylyltransferase